MLELPYLPNADRYSVDKMKYRRSGKSGILLPEISLGFWQNFGDENDYHTCRQIVEYAFDNGITYFDLANNYGPPYGAGEETFGRIIKQSLQPFRHELFIATKAGYDMWNGPYGNWGSRKYLINSLEQSLQRMNLDYVDLFYSHRYDPETPLEETLQAMVDMVRQGKALYLGISRYPYEATKFAFEYLKERDVKCLVYQGKYNMLTLDVEEQGILDLCQTYGVGFVPFSPLAQGLLTDKYLSGDIPYDSRMNKNMSLNKEALSKDLVSKLAALNEVAQSRGQTLAELALTWLLSDARITSVLVGARNVNQLKMNIRSIFGAHLSEKEMQGLSEILAR